MAMENENNFGCIREVKLGEVEVYLSHSEPCRQDYFSLGEEIKGFGVYCVKKDKCPEDNCSGKLKLEISELIYGKEIIKVWKLSYQGEGVVWFWFGPLMKKLLSRERKLCLEVLSKERISDYAVIVELAVSETGEVLGYYNITNNLVEYRNQWQMLEIPLGVEGLDIDWFKLNKPGTFTLQVKIIPLNNNETKGNLYFRRIAIK
ncbi:MAG: hypothetical protein AB7E08_04065 [Candidatus Omnitrophota bacterium]